MACVVRPTDQVYVQVTPASATSVLILVHDGADTVAFPLDRLDLAMLVTLLQRELSAMHDVLPA